MNVYLPGQNIDDGYQLDVDLSVYEIYQPFHLDWPCLSFDILSDNLGNERVNDPFSFSFVTGTQADKASKNSLFSCTLSSVFRSSKKPKIKVEDDKMKDSDDDEDEDESDSDSDEETTREPPILEHMKTTHQGSVNRTRIFQRRDLSGLVASWSETGTVSLYSVSPSSVNSAAEFQLGEKPFGKVSGHKTEGFSLSWLSSEPKLLSGDCQGNIILSQIDSTSSSSVQKYCLKDCSVEDLEWSPEDLSIFSSCSTDGCLRIFDIRQGTTNPVSIQKISETDVNVLSWNKSVHHLMATGDDNGQILITDLRMLGNEMSPTMASFQWHRGAISSIEWNPNDATIFAASGLDNQITLWDLSLEEDQEDLKPEEKLQEVPAQLLFIHQGQTDVKEVHWHKQIPGLLLSTAADGFNVFKTINI